MQKKTNYVASLGVFLALALIFSYVESLIPFYFGVPGMKLGLTNVVVVVLLYLYGPKEAITISVLRIFLAGFMFGNMFSIVYSLAGGVLSFIVMAILHRTGLLRMIAVSVCGGVTHNIGQLIVATILVENYNVLLYAPVLILAGIVTGGLIGIAAAEIHKRIAHIAVDHKGKWK